MHSAPPQDEKPSGGPTRKKKRSRFTSSAVLSIPSDDNLASNPTLVPPAIAHLRATLPERKALTETNDTSGIQQTQSKPPDGPPPKRRRQSSRFGKAKINSNPQLTPTVPTVTPTANSHLAPTPYFDIAAIPIAPQKTLQINKEIEKKQKLETVLKITEKDFLDTDPHSNPHFDPALGKPPRASRSRRKDFKFFDQGTIVAQAQHDRHRALVQTRRNEFTAKLTDKSNTSELPVLPPLEEDLTISNAPNVPTIEWWDLPFVMQSKHGSKEKLADVSKLDGSSDEMRVDSNKSDSEIKIREERITHYIHHPNPVVSVKPKKEPPVIPLMLTKKETKKLRRQRRMEAHKEQQEMIAAGLLPPLPPKVKISNMMRVLTTETSVDPTKMEAEVRLQVEARRLKHEAENEARKKSGEEKREKAREKREKDKASGLHAAVFRVDDLSFVPHRFKIDRNAKQLELTGIMLLFKGCNVVVVEGGEKALRKYKALMLRRIDWSKTNEQNKGVEKEGADAEVKKAEKPEQPSKGVEIAPSGNSASPAGNESLGVRQL